MLAATLPQAASPWACLRGWALMRMGFGVVEGVRLDVTLLFELAWKLPSCLPSACLHRCGSFLSTVLAMACQIPERCVGLLLLY